MRLIRIVEQIFWANSLVINWINDENKENEEALKLMSHILNAGTVWVCRANQKPADRETFKVHPIPTMREMNESNHQGLIALVKGNTEVRLNYSLFDGSPGLSSIEEMIIHVFSHGFHHFGQMAATAAISGKKFPNVSYIGFTRTQ